MSHRFASQQLADLRHDAQRFSERAGDQDHVTEQPDFMELSMQGTSARNTAVAVLAVEDEDVARRSPARLLITAATQHGVETLAQRVHATGPRAQFPFIQTWAGDLPIEPELLEEYCTSVLAAAAGGSVLFSAVEQMPPSVQDALHALLDRLEFAHGTSAEVRLISGTTTSLFERVAAGTFSERLFYRLNIIHLLAGAEKPARPPLCE
jgi:Transcriptional regulator containing PAS, AAA-type ATPase, and DNA-binding domains